MHQQQILLIAERAKVLLITSNISLPKTVSIMKSLADLAKVTVIVVVIDNQQDNQNHQLGIY